MKRWIKPVNVSDPVDAAQTKAKVRHVMLAVGGGMFKMFDETGLVLNLGEGGFFKFQYTQILRGLGVELEAGYFYNGDRYIEKDAYIHLVPVLASPFYKFTTRVIEVRYMYVFETISSNTIGARVYFGVML